MSALSCGSELAGNVSALNRMSRDSLLIDARLERLPALQQLLRPDMPQHLHYVTKHIAQLALPEP